MQKIKKIILLIINILLINSIFIKCYATAVTVTKENLNTALEKFVSSVANENNYKITVSDSDITVASDEKSYTINYDLTGKPTFTLEIPIEQGMSYEDFKDKTDNLNLPMIGYIATANIQGVEYKDASAYFLMSYIVNGLNGSWTSDNSYVIFDDTDLSDGVTIDKDENNTKIINVSEFGDRVMEYVNSIYKDKQTITDSTEGINSYDFTIEEKDATTTSCKLVSSLSVNLDADFSKLKGYSDQMGESFLDKSITKENADYVIELKVGQKCRIETTQKITENRLSGTGCEYIEVNEKCAEIIGESVGKANGYINIGNEKKTIFVIIEENSGSTTLDTITLKINGESEMNETNDDNKKQEEVIDSNKNSISTDNSTAKSDLPQTGENKIICIIILLSLALIIVYGIKLNKYKDIK